MKYSNEDLAYMRSLAAAVMAKRSSKTRAMLYLIAICVVAVILWMDLAQIDEITRGQGKVVPSGQNQIVQNLEGGIVQKLLVKEGDVVKKGQVLIKLDNKSFESSLEENKSRLSGLLAKKIRLLAQAEGAAFDENVLSAEEKEALSQEALDNEKSLYESAEQELEQKKAQRQSEVKELQSKIAHLSTSYGLLARQSGLTQRLYKKGSVSEVEYLQISRELNGVRSELSAARLALPKAQAALQEAELNYKNEAKKQLNETNSQIAAMSKTQIGLDDRVDRTRVISPVNGVISKLNVHTEGGVIKPGEEIAQIVPADDRLIAEVQVKPADVAFLREGMPAVLKFSAYDFSIYGGLKARVAQISADTQTNERTQESFYTVRLETHSSTATTGKELDIKVGMIVTADIITGKKSILDYLLKPIFKTKQNALRER